MFIYSLTDICLQSFLHIPVFLYKLSIISALYQTTTAVEEDNNHGNMHVGCTTNKNDILLAKMKTAAFTA